MAALLGLALAAAALVALMGGKGGGSSSPQAGAGGTANATDYPSGSQPDGTLATVKPVKVRSTAKSGTTYETWMWPAVPGVGVYTVARLAGSQAWISFIYNATTGTRVPAKTNVMQLSGSDAEKERLLKGLRSDWELA